jgi:hypothetical protein
MRMKSSAVFVVEVAGHLHNYGDLAWFCFLFPLVEPDRRISRIRLSEKTHEVPCDAACNL